MQKAVQTIVVWCVAFCVSTKSWGASTDFRTWVNYGIHIIFHVSKPNIILFSWGILDSFCATGRIRTRGLRNWSRLEWHSPNRFKLVVKHKITNRVRRNQPVHGFIESHNDSYWCTVTSLSPGSFSFMCCLRLPLAQRQRTKIRLRRRTKEKKSDRLRFWHWLCFENFKASW